jgi:hypothetical protein
VVQVAVGEEYLVQAAKAKPAAEQLALGALATVHEETVLSVQYDSSRQPAPD